jgi:hypothetical protein
VWWLVDVTPAGAGRNEFSELTSHLPMSELFLEDDYSEQLTRVYVALAMAQDATKRWVDEKPEYEPLKGLVTTLDVTKMLLEEILQKSMPKPLSITSRELGTPELIM